MNIGLVYSGGISKCAYQVGFTQALLSVIPRDSIKAVAGASMGLFTAYGLSTDKLNQLQDMYESLNMSKPQDLFWQVCAKKVVTRAMNSFVTLGDYLSIPVCFPLTYIPPLTTKYYWIYGDYNPFWKKYFRAASHFPIICGLPERLNHRLAIDGGTVDNIPIYPILRHQGEYLSPQEKLDLIIVCHFDSRYSYRREFRTDIPILDMDLSICNDFKKDHFDFSRAYVNEMIHYSREYGFKIARKVFGGSCTRASFQRRANEIYTREHEEREYHSSVDRVVSIFNTLGKALRNDSRCNEKLY